MIDQDLLEILACPEDKTPVRMAVADELDRLNTAINAGSVVNRGGESVTETLEAGLVREDGKYVYPIREEIPIMLIDEAIELPGA
jgi:uncharacterized protein YbaR (Trm112 family)